MKKIYLKYKKYCIFSLRAGSVFGVLSAAASILSFIQNTYDLGLSYTMLQLLNQFNTFLDQIFSWFEPALNWLLEKINPDLSLHDGWENIMLLCLLYYVRDGLSFFHEHNGRLDKTGGLLMLMLGFMATVATTVVAGVQLQASQSYWSNLGIGLIPLLTFGIYRLIRAVWTSWCHREEAFGAGYLKNYLPRVKSAAREIVFGALIIATVLLFEDIRTQPKAYMIALFIAMFAFAIKQILGGWRRGYQGTGFKLKCAGAFNHGTFLMGFKIIMVYVSVLISLICSYEGTSGLP